MLTKNIEALVLASDEPLSFDKLRALLERLEPVESSDVRAALSSLEGYYADRGIQLKQVGGGWQFRTAPACANIVEQLWQTRPPRLSRSMLETLAIIAYQQPTTRAEIEALRGIKVSSSIIGGLLERRWIKVLGRKDVPGRPHLYGTNKQFLEDFGLNSLQDLPDSSQLMETNAIQQEKLNLPEPTETTEHNDHEQEA